MNEEEKILNYKLKKCKQCGAPTNSKDSDELYCSQCGAPVVNYCSNYNCGEVLMDNAKYCKKCGSPSTFLNYGMFDDNTPDDDLPF